MLMDTIEGMDKVFKKDVFPGAVILVNGQPGSLKSGLTFNIMSNYLKDRPEEFGVYLTLEESVESHVRNVKSMGIDIPGNLFISDYGDFRRKFGPEREQDVDHIQMLEGLLTFFKREKGEKFTIFALDSLAALYSLLQSKENLRARIYNLFKFFRDLELTSFIIMETSRFISPDEWTGSEEFMADGIIETGLLETREDTFIYLQVLKMRAASHSRVKHLMEVTPHGIKVVGPLLH